MKITIQNRKTMCDILRRVVKELNIPLHKFDDKPTRSLLWYKSWVFATYPSDNPNALYKGKRVMDQIEFPLYPDKSNDDHIESAMKWCINKLIEEAKL